MFHIVSGVIPSVVVIVFLVWFGVHEYRKQQKPSVTKDNAGRAA